MPQRDGTGPMGEGTMTGRGLGICSGTNESRGGRGLGRGCGRGGGRGVGRGMGRVGGLSDLSAKTPTELLQEEKAILKSRVDALEKRLENLE